MTTTLHSKAQGKTIQLDQNLGASDGQVVEVQIRVIPTEGSRVEGVVLACAGSSSTT
ncbi:MAG: hypothetical protein ACP5XB_21185 [Isosphaeraceae bacterium]